MSAEVMHGREHVGSHLSAARISSYIVLLGKIHTSSQGQARR